MRACDAKDGDIRQLLPLTGRGEAVKVDQGDPVDHGVADLDDAAQPGQGLLIDLFVGQKFRVIEEIPKEPAQLPECLLGAVETPDDRMPGKLTGFEDAEAENVEGLLSVPTELGTIDSDEKDAVGNLRP